MKVPRTSHQCIACLPARIVAIAVVVLFALLGSRLSLEAGPVQFLPGRFEPEEAGYLDAVRLHGGGISPIIDVIQSNYFEAAYWLSIDDPGKAEPFLRKVAADISTLHDTMIAKRSFLEDTLPPPLFERFHTAMCELLAKLEKDESYASLDGALRTTFRELNRAKLVIDDRPVRTFEQPQRNQDGTVSFRPLALPILYNITTGVWSFSPVIPTPVGILSLNIPAKPTDRGPNTGPILEKVTLGTKTRYVLLQPGTSVCFEKDQLRLIEQVWGTDNIMVLQLEGIGEPGTSNSGKRSLDMEVRRAIPIPPKRLD